jgi:hypothetical protein
MAKAKPKLDGLPQARESLNTDPAFRKLGSADLTLGLVIGDQARLITFEAFEIAAIDDASAADMRDADLVIEMTARDWNDYLRKRASGKAGSLLTLDLDRHVVSARNPLKRLLLERYNRSIQALLDTCGRSDPGGTPLPSAS